MLRCIAGEPAEVRERLLAEVTLAEIQALEPSRAASTPVLELHPKAAVGGRRVIWIT